MSSIKSYILLVCLAVFLGVSSAAAQVWNPAQDWSDYPEAFSMPVPAQAGAPQKVQTKKIMKCKPLAKSGLVDAFSFRPDCILPVARPGGWEMGAEVFFARVKGKVRYSRGTFVAFSLADDLDLNADLGIPDHGVMGAFSIAYRFRPNWSIRYNIMPMSVSGAGQSSLTGRTIVFGTETLGAAQSLRSKWERLYQRVGLVYDPISTPGARVGVFADYVRINDKLTVIQVGCCGSTMDSDLNMAMAGLEFEKCLKTTRMCNTLSLDCKAGVAFLDDAVGSDISTGLKYSIPLNSGRSGYIRGGYRYVSYNKKYSDVKMFDTAMEGGFLQMGFMF
jgi:hypothetical protein